MTVGLDAAIGRCSSALRQHGMWETTLLVFTSDNGGRLSQHVTNYPFKGGKYSNFEGGVRVRAALGGGALPAALRGQSSAAYMHLADWLPTLAHVAGVSGRDERAEAATSWNGAHASGLGGYDGEPMWPMWLALLQRLQANESIASGGTAGAADTVSVIPADVAAQRTRYLLLEHYAELAGSGNSGADAESDHGISAADNQAALIEVNGQGQIGSALKFLGGVIRQCHRKRERCPVPHATYDRDCRTGCLFDLANDPTEEHDLATSRPDDLARLKRVAYGMRIYRFDDDADRGVNDAPTCASGDDSIMEVAWSRRASAGGYGVFSPWLADFPSPPPGSPVPLAPLSPPPSSPVPLAPLSPPPSSPEPLAPLSPPLNPFEAPAPPLATMTAVALQDHAFMHSPSVHDSYRFPGHANDGNLSSFVNGEKGLGNWISVRLHPHTSVGWVAIYNRDDQPAAAMELGRFEIWTSSSAGDTSGVDARRCGEARADDSTFHHQPLLVWCGHLGAQRTFVTLLQVGTTPRALMLAELVVYPFDERGRNRSRNSPRLPPPSPSTAPLLPSLPLSPTPLPPPSSPRLPLPSSPLPLPPKPASRLPSQSSSHLPLERLPLQPPPTVVSPPLLPPTPPTEDDLHDSSSPSTTMSVLSPQHPPINWEDKQSMGSGSIGALSTVALAVLCFLLACCNAMTMRPCRRGLLPRSSRKYTPFADEASAPGMLLPQAQSSSSAPPRDVCSGSGPEDGSCEQQQTMIELLPQAQAATCS